MEGLGLRETGLLTRGTREWGRAAFGELLCADLLVLPGFSPLSPFPCLSSCLFQSIIPFCLFILAFIHSFV